MLHANRYRASRLLATNAQALRTSVAGDSPMLAQRLLVQFTGLVPCPVATQLLNELIIDAQNEKSGRPVSHEQGAMVITKHLHC